MENSEPDMGLTDQQLEPPKFPDHLESQPRVVPKHEHKAVYIVIVLLVVIFAGGGYLAYLSFNHRPANVTAKQTAASSPVKSQNSPAINTAPAVETSTLGGVNAAYLTLPLTMQQAETDPVNGPPQNIVTASGHYLLLDPRGFTYTSKNNRGGKLIYDGKVVYNGPLLFRFALSTNGQHYIIILDTSTSQSSGVYEIIIDGKSVQTVPVEDGLYYPNVSDNGKDYTYVTGQPHAKWSATELVKNGTVTMYTNDNGFAPINLSSDLNSFIAGADENAIPTYDVVLNGRTIATNLNFGGTSQPSVAISSNGNHYIYTDGKTLFLDGKSLLQAKGVAAMAVGNNGSYGVADPLSNQVTIDGTAHTISNQFAQDCNPGCGGSSPMFSMSNDGIHFIYGTQSPKLWILDGKDVTPSGTVEGVEFVNDTIYIYRWAE